MFRCQEDKGKFSADCIKHKDTTLGRSCWETRGFSYEMNAGLQPPLANPPTKREFAGLLSGKMESWIPDPSRFILMFEPPAVPQVCGHPPMYPPCFPPKWHQWHRRRVKTIFEDPRLAPAAFVSPILFLDGHVAFHDFSKSVMTDPPYYQEETKEWIWYKAKDQL